MNQKKQDRLFNPAIYYSIVLAVLFFVAFGIRVYGIADKPYDFHPVKQYRSALTARALYYQSTPTSFPSWKLDVSEASLRDIGVLVPPILDQLAALVYRFSGSEQLWVPRLLSSFFWLIGGVFLFLIARKIVTIDAAIVCVAFYLILPFGVIASQSFQPDPLMIMFMIIGIYTIILYDEVPSLLRLLIAAFISLLAILVKPVVLPILIAVFVALKINKSGIRGTIVSPHTFVFLGIVVVPAVAYYGYNIIFVSEQLNQQADKSFVPSYFLEFRFWDGWLKRIRIVMGYTYFLGGILGALMYREHRSKALILGLWIGYFIMCILFNYTAGTHDYYHLPLIPIVALSIGSIAMAILEKLDGLKQQRYWYTLSIGVLVVGLFLAAGTSIQARRKLPSFEHDIQVAEEIGRVVNHSVKTIHLAPYQGHPLMYYGELSGRYWPYGYDIRDEQLWEGRSISAAARLNQLTNKQPVDYFIVADKEEFKSQQDLNQILTEKFPIFVESNDYIIFNLR